MLLDAKTKHIGDKIPSVTALATTAALPAVENKIPRVSDLVKKTDYEEKIKDIDDKYFITFDFSQCTKIKNKELINRSDISKFLKKI